MINGMIPIIVAIGNSQFEEKYLSDQGWMDKLRAKLDLSVDKVGVKELREWLKCLQWSEKGDGLNVYWIRAVQELSVEGQNTLLKSLEEIGENQLLVMTVDRQESLLATITSRCRVIKVNDESEKEVMEEKVWREMVAGWKGDWSDMLAQSDKWADEDKEKLMERIINKLRQLLRQEPNPKRIEILTRALDCFADFKRTNTNPKLVMDRFLLTTMRVIRT